MIKKLSVITVSYNSIKTISECVSSILSNKTLEIEYIVIDGNSIDGTKEFLASNQSIDLVVSERDSGIYEAMNKGWRQASGTYILYVNSDDSLDKNFISSFLYNFNEYSQYDLLAGSVNFLNQSNVTIRRMDPVLKAGKREYFIMPCSHQGLIMRRDLIKRLGGFDESFKLAGDFDILLRALASEISWKIIPEVVSNFTLGGLGENFQVRQKEIAKIYKKNNFSLVGSLTVLLYGYISYKLQKILPVSCVKKIKELKKSPYRNL